ncbi:MAG TPA: hypothetical protein VK205_16255 [Prolixibacteraceae bacterium]|nr:hypothetical protein [Prolixibacteraceae bacterium]
MKQIIQLVAFNIPYPPDYGGVIDVFYKIKALYECGVIIHLHCFEYNRPQAVVLEKYCESVYYYKRPKGINYQRSLKPYIVVTRANRQLINNLSFLKAPIIFEGLHTCYYLNHPMLKDHVKLVRTHNIEHEYYHHLYSAEKNFIKRAFYRIEAFKLKRFEAILKEANHLLCISPNDYAYFNKKYHHSHLIPAFHPYNEIKSKPGKGEYILFHGNLSVAENIQAVTFLVDEVVDKINFPVIIAGKDPSESLVQKISLHANVRLIANPNQQEMESLIENAHISLIPTFQDTGIKLKLLASLFSGRFCITNSMMTDNTGLEHLCYKADSPEEMIEAVNVVLLKEFTVEDIEKRKQVLDESFSNHQNAMKIIDLLI